MIRRNQEFLNKVNILVDMLLVVLAYLLASWLRLDILHGYIDNMASISGKTVAMALAYSVMLFFLLSFMGFYNTTRTRRLIWKVRIIFFAVTVSILIVSTLLFVFRLEDFSRGVLLIFYLSSLLLLIGKYVFMRLVLSRFRGKGYNLKHVVIIGTGELARQYQQDIAAEPELGFHVLGFIGARNDHVKETEYLGNFEMLDQQLLSPEINEVVIALDPGDHFHLRAQRRQIFRDSIL